MIKSLVWDYVACSHLLRPELTQVAIAFGNDAFRLGHYMYILALSGEQGQCTKQRENFFLCLLATSNRNLANLSPLLEFWPSASVIRGIKAKWMRQRWIKEFVIQIYSRHMARTKDETAEWEKYRDELKSLWLDKRWTLKRVQEYMSQAHNLCKISMVERRLSQSVEAKSIKTSIWKPDQGSIKDTFYLCPRRPHDNPIWSWRVWSIREWVFEWAK